MSRQNRVYNNVYKKDQKLFLLKACEGGIHILSRFLAPYHVSRDECLCTTSRSVTIITVITDYSRHTVQGNEQELLGL